jgi:serine phosphatase RsbU (regulator of sigma subunit)/HAMP domain-containing protein
VARKRKKVLKLRHKLLLLVLSLSVIPLGVVGWQSLSGLQQEIDADLRVIFKEKVSSTGRLIELKMESLEKKIVEAVHFRRLGAMNPKQMELFVLDLLKQFSELSVVTVLDETGEEVMTAVSEGEVSPKELHEHTTALHPDELEQVYGMKRRFSKIHFARDRAQVTLYTPFEFLDRPARGMVAILVDLTSIQHLIEDVEFSKSQRGMVLLFDEEGYRIAGHGDKKTIAKAEQHPYVKQAYLSKSSVASSTGLFVDAHGAEQMGAYAFFSEKLGWMIFMSEPKEDVFRSADLLFDQTLGVILITVVMSILAGLLTAKLIIRPLKALVKGAEEIGRGNLKHRIPKLSSDEIGTLCVSFSDMGENLLNREQTIARIREIAGELNSMFQTTEVLSFGSKSLEDLISGAEIEMWFIQGEQWQCYRREQDPAAHSKPKGTWSTSQDIEMTATGDIEELEVPMGKLTPKGEWICKGMIVLKRSHFGVLEQQIAQILGAAISVSMVNIDFLMESVANERRAHELEIAELVQKTLYPEHDPIIEHLDLGSFLVSSSETGGDYYGYILSPCGKTLSVLVGDVTGHGAPAALVTAATSAFFKTVEHLSKSAEEGEIELDLHDPSFLLQLLNRIILETARGRLVMTFFVSTIDLESGEMVYANAGHNAPWVWRANPSRTATPAKAVAPATGAKKTFKIKLGGDKKKKKNWENINSRGMRLGEVEEASFDCKRTQLNKGDIMVWYTDGWIENTNTEMEEFGKMRCQKILEENKELPPDEMIEKLREASWDFYGDEPREDDVTIVIGKVKANWGES